jgi:hypothetical protein
MQRQGAPVIHHRKKEVCLGFAASTRHLLSNVLPSVDGYYDNYVYPDALAKTCQEVKKASLVERSPFGKILGQAHTNGPVTVRVGGEA